MTLHRRGVSRDGDLGRAAASSRRQYRGRAVAGAHRAGQRPRRLERALEALCDIGDDNLELIAALGDGPRDAIFHEPGDDG